jgi:hypothetical protein
MKFGLLIILFLFLVSAKPSPPYGFRIIDTSDQDTLSIEEADSLLNAQLSQIVSKVYNRLTDDDYPYQLGAFKFKYNAEALFRIVRKHIDSNAVLKKEDGYYKVRVTRLPDTREFAAGRPEELSVPVVTEPQDSLTAGTDIVREAARDSDIAESPLEAESAVHDILFIKGDSPWLKKITYLGKSIALVNSLIITIFASIVTMVVLLTVILLNRRRMEREERLKQYLMEKYQSLIIDYLFGDASPEEFRSIASDMYRRQVLIDQMIDVSINLKGDDSKKLLGLYKHLGLDKDSIKRACDHRWHKKIKGFRELAFMNIKDANAAIYKAINSKNEILRMEAQIALVRLSEENPFEFLSHLSRPFSLWEQITLHELIIQHDIPVPGFKTWLTSPNPTVVMFALRMIREFNQKDAEDEVREILLHQSPQVRQLAVQVAGDLNMRSTLETMKKMYKNQEHPVCLEIVRSMGKMPDLSMMGFLKLVLDKEDDVQLQIEATKAIENNGEEGVKALVKLMKSEYKNYNIIVRHVLDRRIY